MYSTVNAGCSQQEAACSCPVCFSGVLPLFSSYITLYPIYFYFLLFYMEPAISFIFVFTRLYCVLSFFLFNLLFLCSSFSLHLCSMEILCCTSVSNSGLSLYNLLSIHFLFILLFFLFSDSHHYACLLHSPLCCSLNYSTSNLLYLDIWSLWFIIKSVEKLQYGCIQPHCTAPLHSIHCHHHNLNVI